MFFIVIDKHYGKIQNYTINASKLYDYFTVKKNRTCFLSSLRKYPILSKPHIKYFIPGI